MNKAEIVFDNIITRRSVRRFNDKEITEAEFLHLIEAATWAPNGCKAEPWFFYVITNKIIIEAMRAAVIATNPQSDFYKQYQTFHNARYLICACLNTDKRWYHRDIMSAEGGVEAIDNPDYFSLAAAIENLLLCAHSQGFGACWIGVSEAFRTSLEKIIGLEDNQILAANIAIGHYDEIMPAPKRRPAEDVMKFIK